jgi:hypothetical protein
MAVMRRAERRKALAELMGGALADIAGPPGALRHAGIPPDRTTGDMLPRRRQRVPRRNGLDGTGIAGGRHLAIAGVVPAQAHRRSTDDLPTIF